MNGSRLPHRLAQPLAAGRGLFLLLGLLVLLGPVCQNAGGNDEDNKEVMVRFANGTQVDTEVYCVDGEGEEMHFGVLRRGEDRQEVTRETHVWRFKHAGQVIDTYTAKADTRQFYMIRESGGGEEGGEGEVVPITDPPTTPTLRTLSSDDFSPAWHDPGIRFMPDGFELPNRPVNLWSRKELYNFDQDAEFLLAFDATLTDSLQEIIIAFSKNKTPWGQEGADALTVRLSPSDQDIWFRTGFYEGWLPGRLYYDSSEEVVKLNQKQQYRFVFTSEKLTVSIDGQERAAVLFDSDEIVDRTVIPRSGHVGFAVFGSQEAGEQPITYQSIAVRKTPHPRTLAGGGGRDIEVEPVDPDPAPDGEALDLAEGRNFALIIGVQDYVDENLKPLMFPVADAENFQQVLTGRYTFDPQNVTVLKNPRRGDIMQELATLKRKIQPNDNLLIFYAGHGTWDADMEQGFWLPADAERDFRTNWLSNGTLRDHIKSIKTQHTLLITDACFSGSIFAPTRNAFADASVAINQMVALPSRKAITSGTLKEVPDKSVFIEFLINELKRNDQDFLAASRLFNAIEEPVVNNSPLQQVPQYGAIFLAGDQGGQFIFRRKR